MTSIAVLNRVVFSTDMEGNVKIWNLDALEKGSLKSLTAGKKRVSITFLFFMIPIGQFSNAPDAYGTLSMNILLKLLYYYYYYYCCCYFYCQ